MAFPDPPNPYMSPAAAQAQVEQALAAYLAAAGGGLGQMTGGTLQQAGLPLGPAVQDVQMGNQAAAASLGVGLGNINMLSPQVGGVGEAGGDAFSGLVMQALSRSSGGGGGGGGAAGSGMLDVMRGREETQLRAAEFAQQKYAEDQKNAAAAAEQEWEQRKWLAEMALKMSDQLGGNQLDWAKLGLDKSQFEAGEEQNWRELVYREDADAAARADADADKAADIRTTALGKRNDFVTDAEQWAVSRALELAEPYEVEVPKPGSVTGKTIKEPRTRTRREAAAMLRREFGANYRNELKRFGIKGRRVNEIILGALAGAGFQQPTVTGGSDRQFGPTSGGSRRRPRANRR